MLRLAGVGDNFRFLVVAVTRQVELSYQVLEAPSPGLVERLRGRDDYIDQLKSLIENATFGFLQQHEHVDDRMLATLRSAYTITANLESIADKAVSIAAQTSYLPDPEVLRGFGFSSAFDEIIQALRLVEGAFTERDVRTAEAIGRVEEKLDELHSASFEHVLAGLGAGGDPQSLVTALMVSHYLERIGDRLENIAEAIILLRMGERLKLRQYRSLRSTAVAATRTRDPLDVMRFTGIWGTRGGARIGRLGDTLGGFEQPSLWEPGELPPRAMIYKEGDKSKIREEKKNIELWDRLLPGLAPSLVEYQEDARDAVILTEQLMGGTILEIALDPESDLLREALGALQETCDQVWSASKRETPVRSGFMRQLKDRLEDVYCLHPRYREAGPAAGQAIDGHDIPGYSHLVQRVAFLDDELYAPFAVFGHGDFNLDNVIYNPATGRIHYIDLHRSGEMDYVQDVAVFLVSMYRVPVWEPEIRGGLAAAARSFFGFAAGFAARHGDRTYEARLAAALARSFITSTRFEFKVSFADDMKRRSAYLLERLEAHHPSSWETFRLSAEVVVE